MLKEKINHSWQQLDLNKIKWRRLSSIIIIPIHMQNLVHETQISEKVQHNDVHKLLKTNSVNLIFLYCTCVAKDRRKKYIYANKDHTEMKFDVYKSNRKEASFGQIIWGIEEQFNFQLQLQY